MAENKKSFVLYADYIEIFEELSDTNAGKLAKHIFRYVNDKNPKEENRDVKLSFIPIKQQLKRDLKKWEGIREKRSIAGKASAESRKQNSTKPTSVKFDEQTPTNPTVNVNDNVTVNVNDIYKEFDFFRDDFKTVWLKEFIPLKKNKKASVTDRAIKSGLNKIKRLSNNNYDLALKILEKSVDSGWTDFYELKYEPKSVIKKPEKRYIAVDDWDTFDKK